MSSRRKLEALRNLAERPGTEAEGKLAREILDRLEVDTPLNLGEWAPWKSFVEYEAGRINRDGFIERLRRHAQWHREQPLPTTWMCACGQTWDIGIKGGNIKAHAKIQDQIRARFTKGDRVFYNYLAYSQNCTASVAGYVRPTRENGNHPWAWITLKFDHLKNNRQVPIYSTRGWHLSKERVDPGLARTLSSP